MMTLARRAALLMALASFTGCHAQSGFGRGTVVPRGAWKGSGFLEAQLVTVRALPDANIPLPGVLIGAGAARGMTRHFELGARAWGVYTRHFLTSYGGAIDTKWQLSTGSPKVALATSAGYHSLVLGGTPWHSFQATVPLLFGFDIGKHQLIAGPRIAHYVLTSYGQNTINAFLGGASVGFAWRVSSKVDLLPELTYLYSPVRFGGEVGGADQIGANFLNLGLGITVDL